MDLDIAGRKAIVCASSRGLGRACATRLAEAGWAVGRVLDGSVRFMCSWATTPDAIDELGAALRRLLE